MSVDLWDSERSAQHLHRPSAPADRHTPTDPADWSHDLLPDWSDEWLVMERESYRQLRLHALERLSETLREMGQHASALMAALSAVRADPLRESAHRQVIAVHLAEGNAAEALWQYHAYRRLLALEVEQEHQEVNELVVALDEHRQAGPDRERLQARLFEVLREDVRDEEDEPLPRLQDRLDTQELRRIGWQWEAVRRTAPTRPHPVVARRPPATWWLPSRCR